MGSVYLTTLFRNLKYILSGVLQERIPWTALVEDRQEQLTLRERSGEVAEMKETLRGRPRWRRAECEVTKGKATLALRLSVLVRCLRL